MTVPSPPKLGTPPAPTSLRKMALEEGFCHPSLFMRDSDGRFETRESDRRKIAYGNAKALYKLWKRSRTREHA
jgi:hypothetical protein